MKLFNTTSSLWFLRQLLQFGGAWLVFKGYATDEQVGPALDALVHIGGPASVLIGFAGNIFASFRSKAVVGGEAISPAELPVATKLQVKTKAKEAVQERKSQTLAKKLSDLFSSWKF